MGFMGGYLLFRPSFPNSVWERHSVETLFRMEGVSAGGDARSRPADTPACETQFRSQVHSQTKFGNEDERGRTTREWNVANRASRRHSPQHEHHR